MPLPRASATVKMRRLRGVSTRCSRVLIQSARSLPFTVASSSRVVSRASSEQISAGRSRVRVSGFLSSGRPLMAASYQSSIARCIRSVTRVLQPMTFSMSAWFIMRFEHLSFARRAPWRSVSYRCCGSLHQHTPASRRRSFCRWHTHTRKTPGPSTDSAGGQ